MSTLIPGHNAPLQPTSVSIIPQNTDETQRPDASYQHPYYRENICIWEKIIASCIGEDAVKALNPLPYLNRSDKSEENVERNQRYLERAVYFNATGRTLEGLIGLAFATDPTVTLGPFDYMADNANGNGVSIYHTAQVALAGVLQTGRHGLLVDVVNDRPAILSYDARDIINWRTSNQEGRNDLTLLVLREIYVDETDPYASLFVEQFREYRMVDGVAGFRLWRRDSKSKRLTLVNDFSPILRPHSSRRFFDHIPFFFCGSKSNSPDIDVPPLKSLSDMNYAHFRDSADYQDSVHFCGQVQPWITGLSEEWRDWLETKGVYVGSRRALLLPAGSQYGMAQAQPNSLAKEAMDDKKEYMVALGARIVEENKTTKTATQAAGDIATGTSVLSLCSSNVSEAVTAALSECGQFFNAESFKDANFRITHDYVTSKLDAQMITSLVAAWQSGAIAAKDLRTVLRNAGIIEPERTDAQIQEEVDSEMPSFNTSPVAPPVTGQ